MILEITFAIGFTISLLCLCLQNMHTQKQIDIIKDDIGNIKFKFFSINEDDVKMLDKLYKRTCMMRKWKEN